MSNDKRASISRRGFVRRTGLATGGLLLGAAASTAPAAEPSKETKAPRAEIGDLPRRVLGRTGEEVTTISLGTAPCGLCPKILPPEIADIVNYALDLGITFIDTAPAYKQSEEGVGMALGRRRKEIFLATKVMEDTVAEAEESLTKSLELLKTDYVDLVYYHSVGSHDVPKAMEPDGVFTWLVKQKKAGKFRFLGISGHHKPGMFAQLLQTDEVDVLMTVINFVDRHTYGFEEKVLPIAQKHDVGIVAMKVFGGGRKSAGSYGNPDCPPELDLKHLDLAVRYALSTPGVAVVNLGVHKKEQVEKNVEMVKNFTALTEREYARTLAVGKPLAKEWGQHFGPVA